MDNKLMKLKEFEEIFSSNEYDGIINQEYIYKEGKIPVLISAPHAVNESGDDYIKVSDMTTGGIALLMNELTGCHVIAKSHNDGIDPNHTNIGMDGNYKEKIISIIKENDIKLLIDLHGLRGDRDTNVDIITHNGMTIGHDEKIINNLEEFLKENNILNYSEDKYYFAKSEKVIVHKIWNVSKIPSIELEINWHYRNFYEEENLMNLINTLESFISNYIINK